MDGVLLPVLVQGIKTRVDGSLVVCVETQELSDSKVGEVFGLRKKLAMMYLSPKDIVTQKELAQVDAIQPEERGGKTPSQRMRAVLYILWSQDNQGYKDFPLYYDSKMERYIEELKTLIKD
jgi:hypothetical protein